MRWLLLMQSMGYRCMGSIVVLCGLSCPHSLWNLPGPGNKPMPPCMARQILIQCITREVLETFSSCWRQLCSVTEISCEKRVHHLIPEWNVSIHLKTYDLGGNFNDEPQVTLGLEFMTFWFCKKIEVKMNILLVQTEVKAKDTGANTEVGVMTEPWENNFGSTVFWNVVPSRHSRGFCVCFRRLLLFRPRASGAHGLYRLQGPQAGCVQVRDIPNVCWSHTTAGVHLRSVGNIV